MFDMFLEGKRYISKCDEEDKRAATALEPLTENNMRVKEIIYDIGYWNEVSAIHNWFVKECGYEGRPIPVSTEDLQKLKADCEKVISDYENHILSADDLFLGETEIDGYDNEMSDLKDTIEIVYRALELGDKYFLDIVYHVEQ